MAAGGAITVGDFKEHFVPRIFRDIDTNIKRILKDEWTMFFSKDSTDSESEESKQYEAAGPAQMMLEGSTHPEIHVYDGWVKKISQTYFGCKGGYTKQVRKFSKEKLMAKITKAVTDSPKQLLNNKAVAYFHYGSTALASVPKVKNTPTVDSICGDGLTIFNTAHTFKNDGGANTFSNKTSAFTSLSQTALQEACDAIEGWTNNQGETLNAEAELLVIPRGLRWKAYELLHSETKSETANRADNALRQAFSQFDFKVWKRLINQTEWYIKTNMENEFRFVFGWDPEKDSEYVKDTMIYWVYLNFAFAHGVNDPRGFYANKL